MRQVVSLTIDGRQHIARVFPMEKVHWEGEKIRCPNCKAENEATALIDIIQYGLVDRDLCITLFDCKECDESFGVEYDIVWEGEGGNG